MNEENKPVPEAAEQQPEQPTKTDGAGGWDRQFYWDTNADAAAEVNCG